MTVRSKRKKKRQIKQITRKISAVDKENIIKLWLGTINQVCPNLEETVPEVITWTLGAESI